MLCSLRKRDFRKPCVQKIGFLSATSGRERRDEMPQLETLRCLRYRQLFCELCSDPDAVALLQSYSIEESNHIVEPKVNVHR